MPGKNVVKKYKPDTCYHVYNRGASKQKIYLDVEDYKTFLGYLKLYLSPVNLQGSSLKVKVAPSRISKNHAEKIDLLCYCLMPNHFHLLLYQREVDSINYFMRSLATKYAMYFNQKYKRVGHLFESIYKAVEIETDEQLVNLSKYIHRNPAELLSAGMILEGYKYSSYGNYLRLFSQTWVKPNKILSLIKGKSYKKFVEVSKQEFSENIINLVFDDLQG